MAGGAGRGAVRGRQVGRSSSSNEAAQSRRRVSLFDSQSQTFLLLSAVRPQADEVEMRCLQPRQLAARVLFAADAVPARVLLLVAHL